MAHHPGRQIAGAAELIEHLKTNPEVLAILQYGSGLGPTAADTDICVVLRRRPEGLESIHFWLASGPVDLNLRTPAELRAGGVASPPGFDEVLRGGEVLYQRQPGPLAAAPAESASPPVPREAEQPKDVRAGPDHSFMRHGHAHVLHKLEHHRDRDPLLCGVLLCGATHWLLGAYAAARGLPYRGEKAALAAIRANDPELLADLEALASAGRSIRERIQVLRRLTEQVLAPVGGPWREGEVLFFSDRQHTGPQPRQRWQQFFDSLVGA